MRVGTEDAVPFTRIGVRWRQASRSQGGCASCGLRVDSPLQKPAQGQSKQSRIPALQQEESTFHVGHRPNDKQEARPKTSTFLPRDRSSTPPQQGRGATPRPTALAAARPGPRPLGPVHTVGCVSSHVSVDSGATGAVLPQKTPERTRSVTIGCQARAPRAPGHGAESSTCRKDPERITRRQLWKELAPPPPPAPTLHFLPHSHLPKAGPLGHVPESHRCRAKPHQPPGEGGRGPEAERESRRDRDTGHNQRCILERFFWKPRLTGNWSFRERDGGGSGDRRTHRNETDFRSRDGCVGN